MNGAFERVGTTATRLSLASFAGLLAASVSAALLVLPCLAGEKQADDLIERLRRAPPKEGARTIHALVRADRAAAYEAMHRLGALGDATSLRLAESLAAAYADVFGDRRPAGRIAVFRAWTPEERAERAEAVQRKKAAKEDYSDARPESALEKFESALATFERIGDEREVAWCTNAIAGVKVNIFGGEKAIGALREARDVVERVGDLRLLSVVENNLGVAYRAVGDLDSARSAIERSLVLTRELGDRAEEGRSLGTLAVIVGAQGDSDAELSLHQQATAIARESGDAETEALERLNLCRLHRDRGNPAGAVAECRRAAEIARRAGVASTEADASASLSLVLRELGRTEEGHRWLERARKLAASAESADLQATVACIRTMTLVEEGNAEAAIPILDAEVSSVRASGGLGLLSIILECRASALFDLGRYDDAMVDLRAAVEAATQSSDLSLLAWRRYYLGANLALLGDFPEALAELESASSLLGKTKSELGRCRVLRSLGFVRERSGDREEARKALEEALRCSTETGQAVDRATSLIDLANLDLRVGAAGAEAAVSRLEVAATLYHEQRNPAGWTECELLAAHAHLLSGNLPAARGLLDRLAPLGPTKRGASNEWRYQFLSARLSALEGDRAGAIRRCERAVAEVERARSGVRRPPWRAAILDDRIEPYRELVRLYLDNGEVENAYRVARLGKARDFAQKLVPPSFEDDAGTRGGEPIPPWSLPVVPSSQLRAVLRDREVLVDYFVLNDRVVAFVARRDGLKARRLTAPPAVVREIADLARYPGRPDPADAPVTAAWRQAMTRLGAALLDPLATDLANADEVLVVANEWLHSVPFPALRFDGRPMIEGRNVSLLPAAEALFSRRRAGSSARGMVALGDPDIGGRGTRLPGAAAEVLRVAALVPGAAWTRTGAEATETAYRARAPSSEWIHLAAHGRTDRLTPSRSRIELASDGGTDGGLTAEEIAARPIAARLVVLSGCDTGADVGLTGGDAPGDEREGLVRAFLKAGASSVVASLWEMDDATSADVLPELYRKLSPDLRPAAALGRLQRAMLRGEVRGADGRALDHPFYWAGLTVYGAGR